MPTPPAGAAALPLAEEHSPMYWALLFIAIALEIAGTVCTKLAGGFSRLLPSIGIVVFYVLSLGLFTLTLKKIDVGVAYAIWSGIGTAAIAVIGFVYFKETFTPLKGL